MSGNTRYQYPDFWDAILVEAVFTADVDGPTVAFTYRLLAESIDSVVGKTVRTYHVSHLEEKTALYLDLRRLGWELPLDIGDLPRIVEEIAQEGAQVELMVCESDFSSRNSVTLVKRYWG
jgi:hypothetical protein